MTRVLKDGSLDPEIITTVNTTPYFQKLFAVDDEYAYGVGYYGDLIRVVKTP